MKTSKTRKTRKPREARPLKPKHVTIEAGQRLLVHVVKGGKPFAEYIAGATEEGVVTAYVAPEAAAPVQTPGSISGT